MQLKRKEAEMDALGVEVVGELRAQLKGERARLERERSNAEVLGLREVQLKIILSGRTHLTTRTFGMGLERGPQYADKGLKLCVI